MENIDILRPLLEDGDIKKTLDLVSESRKDFADITSEGMNLVTASILADIPSVHKISLIQKIGVLFSSQEYCELLNQKLFTIMPEERDRMKDQGLPVTKESIASHCDWYNIFEIAFPWLPLSIFEDFVVYLRDEKKLILDKETVNLVKENFLNTKKYSERELQAFFSSDILKDPADY